MAFNTSCKGLPDLNGTCEIADNECTSYISDTLHKATEIKNEGTSDLKFKVTFSGGEKFKIEAKADPKGYRGKAKVDDDSDTEDPWAATATGQPAVAGKGY